MTLAVLYHDGSLRLLVIGCVVVCNTLLLMRGYRLANPVTILSLAFFLPLAVATLRLSGLQRQAWSTDTYRLLLEAVAAWLVAPTAILLLVPRVPRLGRIRARLGHQVEHIYRPAVVPFARWFAIAIIGAAILSNIVQAGVPLPLLRPDVIQRIHSDWSPGLRVLVIQLPVAAALLLLAYRLRRSWRDLVLLAVLLAVPLTRGGRISVLEGVVAVVAINHSVGALRIRRRWLPVFLAMVVVVAGLFTAFGTQRVNRFGKYDVRYANVIQWKGPADPTGILPTLYAYFPLSFENLDRFVRQDPSWSLPGTASLSWLLVGLSKLNLAFPVVAGRPIARLYVPVSSGATVSTALTPFFLDFGVGWAFLPMVLVMGAWLFFFVRSWRSLQMAVVNAVFTSAFALAAFQPVIVSSDFGQMALAAVLVLPIARALSTVGERATR